MEKQDNISLTKKKLTDENTDLKNKLEYYEHLIGDKDNIIKDIQDKLAKADIIIGELKDTSQQEVQPVDDSYFEDILKEKDRQIDALTKTIGNMVNKEEYDKLMKYTTRRENELGEAATLFNTVVSNLETSVNLFKNIINNLNTKVGKE